ncbi:MAG: heme-copper oxidase subunit III [Gemmatimonadota bacterium]
MTGAVAVVDRSVERGLDVYTQKVGMWVFLCSEVMFFAGLIGSYIVLRFGASDTWAEPGQVLNVPITAVNTFILICSSVTMVKAFAAAQQGDQRGIRLFLLLTFLLGALFLSVQVVEYTELARHGEWAGHHGFTPAAGLYGATFYTMTGFHGFHVLSGVTCLGWATVKAFRGHWSEHHYHGIEVLGLYWHFVDLVWIILFTVVYLI